MPASPPGGGEAVPHPVLRKFFRIHPADEDPDRLLHPERQRSEAWTPQRLGPCDKCGGSGRTLHECESCKGGSPDSACPACHGEVRYLDTCPACEGSGEIDEAIRDGVSVFPSEEGLYRYIAKRGASVEHSIIVELEGVPARDDDFDADQGALLVHPQSIVDSRPVDAGLLEEARRQVEAD